MRYARLLGSSLLLVILCPSVTLAASDADLLTYTCSGGAITMSAKSPWHINPNAPWTWDKGTLTTKDQAKVKFKGSKCEGRVRAFIANGDQPKGPVIIAIHAGSQ